MKIVESFLTENPCYKQGKKITVSGLVLHSVGCAQPDALVFVRNWNKSTYSRACVHGFIDANNGTIFQCLPWDYKGWHVGSGSKGSANSTHIGVEMCEPSAIKYPVSGVNFAITDEKKAKEQAVRTYTAAVELFAFLCEKYNLDPLKKGVIISHKEAHSLGIGSNHGDPDHLWKGLNLPYTMDTFRSDVAKKMGKTVVTIESKPTVAATKLQTAQYKDNYLKGNFKTTTDLNLRSGAGANNYPVIAEMPKGAVVKCNGYYNVVSGTKWYCVQYKEYTGYCSSKYLIKV